MKNPRQCAGKAGGEPPIGTVRRSALLRSVAIILARYNLRRLKRLYCEFDHDIMLPLLLGEIALHNIGVLESGLEPRVDPLALSSHGLACELKPCNAYSIAAATGLPRETVRRKIGRLVELGWIRKSDNGHLYITLRALDHFGDILQSRDLPELLDTADQVRKLLDGGGGPREAVQQPSRTPGSGA